MKARTFSLVIAIASISAPSSAQFIPGAVAAWSFNNGNAHDDIGSHDAVVSFANLAPDRFGNGSNAYALSGNLSNIQVAAATLFSMADSSFSVSLWFKALNDTSIAGQDMVSWYRCGANPGCGGADAALYMMRLTGGHVESWVRDDNASEVHLSTAPDSTFDDGTWHHAVMTVDQLNDGVVLYVDAVVQASGTGTLDSLSAGSVQVPLSFGRRFRMGWATSGLYFKGSLDDIAIYKRALSATEVSQLYAMTNPNVGINERGSLDASMWYDAVGGSIRVGTTTVVNKGVVCVSDLQGRLVTTAPMAGMNLALSTDGWSKGCYVVSLTTSAGVFSSTRVMVY